METATVLVVDDERKIRDLVRLYLEHQGYSVLLAESGRGALETAERARPDLLVLDLVLPDLPGEEVARSLRRRSDVPIIMLTAKASEEDRVNGLRLGADDYLVKPFSPRELVARVEAVLRRSAGSATPSTSFDGGGMVIDRDAREVRLGGEPVELTRSEFDLLHALASHAGRVFSRFELVTKVQGYDYEGYDEDGFGADHDSDGRHAPASRSVSALGARDERGGSVATMPDRRPMSSSARAFDRITTIHPRTYNDAKTIGESFREGVPVIMNLTEMEDVDAKRLRQGQRHVSPSR